MCETSFFNKNSFHIVKPGYDRWKKRKENDKKNSWHHSKILAKVKYVSSVKLVPNFLLKFVSQFDLPFVNDQVDKKGLEFYRMELYDGLLAVDILRYA